MKEFGTMLGIIATLITILGVLVKIVIDYTKLKNRTSNNEDKLKDVVSLCNEKEKDIRLDIGKDIKQIEDKCFTEIKSIRSDMKEEKEYNHESFVKLASEQQTIASALKEVTIVLQSFQTSIDQRLSTLERKIDSITVLKVDKDA